VVQAHPEELRFCFILHHFLEVMWTIYVYFCWKPPSPSSILGHLSHPFTGGLMINHNCQLRINNIFRIPAVLPNAHGDTIYHYCYHYCYIPHQSSTIESLQRDIIPDRLLSNPITSRLISSSKPKKKWRPKKTPIPSRGRSTYKTPPASLPQQAATNQRITIQSSQANS
jgi:hypothetical protein